MSVPMRSGRIARGPQIDQSPVFAVDARLKDFVAARIPDGNGFALAAVRFRFAGEGEAGRAAEDLYRDDVAPFDIGSLFQLAETDLGACGDVAQRDAAGDLLDARSGIAGQWERIAGFDAKLTGSDGRSFANGLGSDQMAD